MPPPAPSWWKARAVISRFMKTRPGIFLRRKAAGGCGMKATGAGQQSGLVQQVTTEAAITDNHLAEIPSHVIFLGLTALVIEEIKGTSRLRIGVAGDGDNRFGNGLLVAVGTEISGPADPSLIYWQPTPVIATPEG